METKICSKCKKRKHFLEFHKNKSHNDGLETVCKDCKSQSAKLLYVKNKAKTSQQILLLEIKKIVCDNTDVTIKDMNSKSREGNIPIARIILSYILYKNFGEISDKSKKLSLSEIGTIVRNDPDHSVINYYIKKANNYKNIDKKFTVLLSLIEKKIIESSLELLYIDLIYKIGEKVVTYTDDKSPIIVTLLTHDFQNNHWICQYDNKLISRGENEMVTINR